MRRAPRRFRYRAGKFVRRNRVAGGGRLLLALALMGGTAVTACQARQARAAQARAERRFADVRKLANSLLFDYPRRDPRPARGEPVASGWFATRPGYLDGLARSRRGSLAPAGAGRRLPADRRRAGRGTLQPRRHGRCRPELRQGTRILETLFGRTAGTPDSAGRLPALPCRWVAWCGEEGRPGGLTHARRARALLDPLVAAAPSDTDLRLELSAANDLLGQIFLEEGKIAEALEYHSADLKQFEAAPESERRLPVVRYAISVTYGYLADAQAESATWRARWRATAKAALCAPSSALSSRRMRRMPTLPRARATTRRPCSAAWVVGRRRSSSIVRARPRTRRAPLFVPCG